MKHIAAEGPAVRAWRRAVWLAPLSVPVPIVVGVWAVVAGQSSNLDFASQWALLFILATVGQYLVLLVIAGVAAGFAAAGRPTVALLLLAGLGALVLAGAGWPGIYEAPYSMLLMLPGAVAALLALAGLLIHARAVARLVSVCVVGLLLVPVGSFGVSRVNESSYFSNDCPPGPSVDLTFSGLESGHFTTSCGLPLKGTELTGCTRTDVDVGLLAGNGLLGHTIWHLRLSAAAGRSRVDSDQTPWGASLLVGGNKGYGGEQGWSGYYTFDGPCSGRIEADLASSLSHNDTYAGPGSPVHVSGHFASPQGQR